MHKKLITSGIGLLLLASPLLASAAACPNLYRNFSFGSRGQDVVELQNFLIAEGDLVAGNNSGYFGRLTRDAVRKFQCREMSICSGSEASNGYGAVGPRTRAKIAGVCSAGGGTVSAFSATPTSGSAPLAVLFTWIPGVVNYGDVHTVDFGDGQTGTFSAGYPCRDNLCVNHTYSSPGTYVAKLLKSPGDCYQLQTYPPQTRCNPTSVIGTVTVTVSGSGTAQRDIALTITSPAAGQSFQQGSSVPVAWTQGGNWSGAGVSFELVRADGVSQGPISDGAGSLAASFAGGVTPGTGTWSIPIGPNAPAPGQYKIRGVVKEQFSCAMAIGISCPTPQTLATAESGVFTITSAATNAQVAITISWPQGGETLRKGNNYNIAWSSVNVPVGAFVYLGLISVDGVAFKPPQFGEIVGKVTPSGYEPWFIFDGIITHTDIAGALGYTYAVGRDISRAITFPGSGSYKIRATLLDSTGHTITATESPTFTIMNP